MSSLTRFCQVAPQEEALSSILHHINVSHHSKGVCQFAMDMQSKSEALCSCLLRCLLCNHIMLALNLGPPDQRCRQQPLQPSALISVSLLIHRNLAMVRVIMYNVLVHCLGMTILCIGCSANITNVHSDGRLQKLTWKRHMPMNCQRPKAAINSTYPGSGGSGRRNRRSAAIFCSA